jgi:hypothetical protein
MKYKKTRIVIFIISIIYMLLAMRMSYLWGHNDGKKDGFIEFADYVDNRMYPMLKNMYDSKCIGLDKKIVLISAHNQNPPFDYYWINCDGIHHV